MEDLTRPVKEFVTEVEFTLPGDLTIKDALHSLQGKHLSHKIIYFYVVDDENKLLGIVPTRRLLLSNPETKIRE